MGFLLPAPTILSGDAYVVESVYNTDFELGSGAFYFDLSGIVYIIFGGKIFAGPTYTFFLRLRL